jgi:hypothetical protein
VYKLMNSAMMPDEGTYTLKRCTKDEFVKLLQSNKFESFIGYPDTAAFISRISGVDIEVSRQQTAVNDGDILLIVRLKYRVADPAEKARFTPSDDDFEFFTCEYRRVEMEL